MRRPFFHKLILSSTIQDNKLRIPDNFVKKFRDELSVAAILSVRDGHVWRVGVRKTGDKVWFQEGWQEFVERYHIHVGYYLVFRYEGNSCFSVSIFNLCNSEINYQSNHCKQYPFEELEDDECISPPAVQNLFAGSKLGTSVNWSGEIDSCTSKGVISQSFRVAQLAKSNEPERKKHKFDHAEQDSSFGLEDDADMHFRLYKGASAKTRTVTTEEREEAINKAKLFEPTNPFCRVVLRPSYLYRGCIMYLPSSFAKKYISGLSGFIKLQLPDGRQWPVQCLYRGGKAKFSRGWYEFVSDNNLEEGDACIFELLQSREFVLKVTVFRVTPVPS